MCVYKITNLVNGKIYIGLTTKGIKERWRQHLNCAKHRSIKNIYLYNSINSYGKDNFKIEQIDTANNIFELNEKEGYWANFYKSYAPNGMNIAPCGNNVGLSKETILKLSKDYSFYSPKNELVIVKNLSEFCKENDLDKCHMYKLAQGKRKNHRGWTLTKKGIIYILDAKDKKLLTITDEICLSKTLLIEFDLIDLNQGGLCQFLKGKTNVFLGRYYLVDENLNLRFPKKHKQNPSFSHLRGKIERFPLEIRYYEK